MEALNCMYRLMEKRSEVSLRWSCKEDKICTPLVLNSLLRIQNHQNTTNLAVRSGSSIVVRIAFKSEQASVFHKRKQALFVG
ncbi:hypothetical protein D3C76_1017380 [compost metagenome]